jgi:hypothetical protein
MSLWERAAFVRDRPAEGSSFSNSPSGGPARGDHVIARGYEEVTVLGCDGEAKGGLGERRGAILRHCDRDVGGEREAGVQVEERRDVVGRGAG